jgi:hypothetical protein
VTSQKDKVLQPTIIIFSRFPDFGNEFASVVNTEKERLTRAGQRSRYFANLLYHKWRDYIGYRQYVKFGT